MSGFLDKFIGLFKWPVAIFCLVSIPSLLESYSPRYFYYGSWKFLSLGAGFVLFFVSRTMADSSMKVNMQILAHELTHTFFALITFHKVKSISIAEDNSGGQMAFEGEGNWLIIIGPYFFPLFAFFYAIAQSMYQVFFPINDTFLYIMSGFLGYFMGYHLDTVLSQIHEKQTDFPKVGYKFCFIFLPGANLFVFGSIMAYNSRGWSGIGAYFDLICKLNANNFNYLMNMI